MNLVIEKEINEHLNTVKNISEKTIDSIANAGEVCLNAIKNGNKIILFGNGGSASDAQHIAAELTGRYKRERRALPAIALTTDTSALTAIGNDYGFDKIFERQVDALAIRDDVCIGISTSGNSDNIISALKKAKEIGCFSIGLSGSGGGKMNEYCDINLIVQSENTARIQEIHITFGHILCGIIENGIV